MTIMTDDTRPQEEITIVGIPTGGKANGTIVYKTLTAAGWATENGVTAQSITIEGLTSNSNGILNLPNGLTKEQMDAAGAGQIIIDSQTNDTIVLKCMGTTPTVDIPVMFYIFGNDNIESAGVPEWAMQPNKPTYTVSEIEGLGTLDYVPNSEKGVANGVATLGTDGKVVPAQLPDSAGKTVYKTLTAANWTEVDGRPTQTITVEGMNASTNGLINLPSGVTEDQVNAIAEAQIIISSQTDNTCTLTCLGTQPTIDVPIEIYVFGEDEIEASGVPEWAMQPNKPTYTAEEIGAAKLGNDGKVLSSQLPELNYLPLSGGTLTGSLTLANDPTQDMQAANKKYVDQILPSWVTTTKPTYTANEVGATTKTYVDSKPTILYGTSDPTSSQGKNGDIYIKYVN